MFKKIRANLVESDEGFSVETLGRAGIRYEEGSITFLVDSEIECGPYDMVVFKKRIQNFDSPIGSWEPLDDDKRDKIIENIRQALLFLGYKPEIEDSY